MTNPEEQLAGFFAKYEPAMAGLGRALRKKLRARLPGLFELVYVYEGQGSLVISYSPTERGQEAVCSLAVYAEQVKLFFAHSPQLSKADPHKLLQGSAKMVRYVPMHTAADLDREEVEALMVAALKAARLQSVAGVKGTTVVKAEEQKKRAVQAKKAKGAAAAGGRVKKARG